MTKDNDRRKSCCDAIVMLTGDKEDKDRRVKNLEHLYKPVNRLSTLFCICIFILGAVLGMTGYLWTRVDAMQNDVSRIVATNESIKEDVSYIKRCLVTEVFKRLESKPDK